MTLGVPKHIAIILDGNRRFAKRLMVKPWKGHEWGAEKFRSFLDWCFEAGVDEVTAYAFSVQNFDRPKEEFEYLMDVFRKELTHMFSKEKQAEFAEKGIRITVIGRLYMLPKDIHDIAVKLNDATKENKKKRINLAIAYGGREEIIDAVKKIAREAQQGTIRPEHIDEETLKQHLSLASEPDLVIRTGGERRTSNFLPWQSSYSEFIFIDKLWPEFEKEDFLACIKDFAERERRFGK